MQLSDKSAADRNGVETAELSKNALGTGDIIFMVIAAAAPMSVVAATMPLAFALGNGAGAPGVYLLAALALALFAVGYVRLLPLLPNAGAFYAIIANSFGRVAGLSAAYVATISYISLCCATTGALSFFGTDLILRMTGWKLDWAVFAAGTIIVLGLLSYFRITLAAKILAIALSLEVLAILTLDVAIIYQRGLSSLDMIAFSPEAIFRPGMGIAAMYAFNSCIGFEGTAIYQEEARDRKHSVPRATYASIAIVGIFYVFTALSILASAGANRIAAVAAVDPGHLVLNLTEQYLGSLSTEMFAILVVTSTFAAVLGLFNNSARYVFSLARDRILPARLAHTHPTHHSPFMAGLPVLALVTLVVATFRAAGLDPLLSLTTSLTGLGSVGLMILLSLTAFGVPLFFARRSALTPVTLVPPVLGGLMIAAGTFLTVINFSALTGVDDPTINRLPWLLLPVAGFGICQALWLKSRQRTLYNRIGSTALE